MFTTIASLTKLLPDTLINFNECLQTLRNYTYCQAAVSPISADILRHGSKTVHSDHGE